MGYLATGEIFENMLQLKHFRLYFDNDNDNDNDDNEIDLF